ncbi:MAG: hypothetical protein ACE5I1_08705 [bacterium]
MLAASCIFASTQTTRAQTTSLRGQLSGWTFLQDQSFEDSQIGLRYIPEVGVTKSLGQELAIDAAVSWKWLGAGSFETPDGVWKQSEIDPYRIWLRFATAQFEARAGLQKINFGPALLLRPLMWFDRIDPRDPLRLTEGVYGLLLRYTFLNNANIWLWGLYGNDDPKGWEIIPPKKNSFEYGGRVQYPLLNGEIAFSYHRREADLNRSLNVKASIPVFIPEQRFALDGTWDAGVGLWFESAVIHQDFDIFPFTYSNFFLIGTDYTFGVGNGIHVLAEHLLLTLSRKPLGNNEDFNLSALSVDYNLGLLDRLQAIVFYSWDVEQFFRFVSWGRFYDNWSIYVNAFWNPHDVSALGFQSDVQSSFGGGLGLQVMVVLNH